MWRGGEQAELTWFWISSLAIYARLMTLISLTIIIFILSMPVTLIEAKTEGEIKNKYIQD